MESGASSISRGGGSRARPKPDGKRRAWSNKEEEVLIASLKLLIVGGFKGDNGFKVGYLTKLEEAMKRAYPGTDLKGHPHINSKLTTWKRTYASLTTALSRTGVGFNVSTNMIDCTDDLWELVVKADKNAENMRYKAFPLYPAWLEIFGKDRATGEGAEDVLDAVNDLMNEDNAAQQPNGDYYVNMDNIVDENEVNSVCQDEKSKTTPKVDGKKRKCTDGLEPLVDMVGKLVQKADKIDQIAQYIGYEFMKGEKRTKVFDLLDDIPDLSLDDKFDLSEILSDNADRLEMFNGLPRAARGPYVQRLLTRRKA